MRSEVWCGLLSLTLSTLVAGCGSSEGDRELLNVRSTEQAFANGRADSPLRSSGSIQVKIGGELQLWVVVCGSDRYLAHRVKAGNTWGAWIRDTDGAGHYLSCSAAPTVGLWQETSQPYPVAYYSDKSSHLIETAWTSATDSISLDLSTYGATQFGEVASEPVVAYFDTANGEMSVIVGRVSDHTLYTLDSYDGAWHLNPIAGGGLWPTRQVTPWSSTHVGQNRYLSVRVGDAEFEIYRRTATSSPYTLLARIPNATSPISFTGPNLQCRDGCLMMVAYDQQTIHWRLMARGTITSWPHQMIAWDLLETVPTNRANGDPLMSYANAGVGSDGVFRFGLTDDDVQASNLPNKWNSLFDMPLNVYSGSRYERDAFYSSPTYDGNELYYVSFDGTHNTFTDMGKTILLGG